MKKQIFLSLILSIVFLGCTQNAKNVYKNEVCLVNDTIFNGVEPNCKEGEVFYFQPNQLMNKQVPIVVSTYFCDFNFPIVQNEGGVTCVYKRKYNTPIVQQAVKTNEQTNIQQQNNSQQAQNNNTQAK